MKRNGQLYGAGVKNYTERSKEANSEDRRRADEEKARISLKLHLTDKYANGEEHNHKIDNVNLGNLFKKHQTKSTERRCFIEADIQELMVIKSVLLLGPGQSSELLSSFFDESCLLSLTTEIRQIFGSSLSRSFEIQDDKKRHIEKTLKVGKFEQLAYQN